ncbi:CynX/NimT family MFS transporter [Domibacillus epiphyticus]|uniref:Transporter n=1 Tax=Domibacillus epiphyticus TaxID=1714355 RepID=A0A1V2A643_9BACI|nr:MFS transporter [Domibacillus epiphyticus]OMP66458.1 transporter [Domibacillus epiphyticus]
MSIEALIERERSKSGRLLLLFSIILLSLNMRSPITAVGPLTVMIRDNLGISSTAAGALTTIPLLGFAVLSPFASKLARMYGMEVVMFSALLILTVGLALRPIGGAGLLFIGTILIGIAIALCNVLMPAFVKMNFAHQMGLMTGFYAMSMNFAGALASGFSIPIASSSDLGWRAAVGFWIIPAVIAIVVWLSQMTHIRNPVKTEGGTYKKTPLMSSPLAWKVTAFMGVQSLLFYSLVAWLPEILQEQGMSAGASGWMLSIVMFSQLPFTFIVPVIADKMNNQRPLVMIAAVLMTGGLTGILFGRIDFVLLWVIMIGIAGGFAFSLSMMFFSLRTRNSFEAADLSGMAQSGGYLFAALGPALFGALHDAMNGWTVPILLLIGTAICLFLVGMGAAKEGYVTEKSV